MKREVREFLRTPFSKHLQNWSDEKLNKLPKVWRAREKIRFDREAAAGNHKQAFARLNNIIEPLENLLNIAADDDDLKQLAKQLAFSVQEKTGFNQFAFDDWSRHLVESYAIRYPVEFDRDAILARLVDDVWWLRNLRNAHARAREAACINAGLVNRHDMVYCSDDTLERRTQQLNRNKSLLENITMQSESGQTMQLMDIAKTGMANQENRRAELMTRIAGFEKLATEYGHKATFVTLTCPSRMHAILAGGVENKKYDGTKPDEAQKYLVKCWSLARAWLHDNDVKFYGLRVVEPHHDGTPHWHLLLFYDGKESTRKKLRYGITRYFIADSRQEIWKDISPRVKWVDIKSSKGTAAGYIAKYVAKNLGGITDEKSDEADLPSESIAARVEAWAATWRIRQFQQIGGHSVSVWREFRRISETSATALRGFMRMAYEAAQKRDGRKADFADFIKAMGGLQCPPRRSYIMVDDDYIMKRGRYGETAVRVVKGVRERFGRVCVANNRERWVRV